MINSTVFDIVAQALHRRTTGTHDDAKERTDIVSLFLDDLNTSNNTDKSCLDPNYLRDIVVNFLIAGRDTSAQTLSWFFYCLSQNKQVETKIREEISAKLPKLLTEQCRLSMDEVSELTYVDAALIGLLTTKMTTTGNTAFVSTGPYCHEGSCAI